MSPPFAVQPSQAHVKTTLDFAVKGLRFCARDSSSIDSAVQKPTRFCSCQSRYRVPDQVIPHLCPLYQQNPLTRNVEAETHRMFGLVERTSEPVSYYINSGTLFKAPDSYPCGGSNGEIAFTCINGDLCTEASICHSTRPVQGTSGYYIGGCTDPTFPAPACSQQCSMSTAPNSSCSHCRWGELEN